MKIVIVDYGLGNIFSIQRAVSFIGYDSVISDNYKEISSADRLILPGVGAFGDAMDRLKSSNLDEVLLDYAASGRPVLGICLGMQLLMTSSQEFGLHMGLNLIPGKVICFKERQFYNPAYKIPHVGWNKVHSVDGLSDTSVWRGTILNGNHDGDFMYFTHSYVVIPDNENNILALTEYGGEKFCSVVKKDKISGCQFHPELSADAGLRIYREFIALEND